MDNDSTRGDDAPPLPPLPTSYYDLLMAIVTDQKLSGQEKAVLIGKLKNKGPISDRATYRSAIWLLGIIASIAIIAVWCLSARVSSHLPDGLIAIASGAVGGLAGLLSPIKNPDQPSS